MAEMEKGNRKRRVRRSKKVVESPIAAPLTPEIEEIDIDQVEEPQEPVVKIIPAEKEVPVEKRGRIVIQDNVLMDIVEKIVDRGKAVVISGGKGEQYLIHAEDASEFAVGRAQSWSEYIKETHTTEYMEWQSKWGKMSIEERIEFAEEMKAEWVHHDTPRINSMRRAEAVRTTLGIQKYKDNYSTRGDRNRVKPRR